MAHERLAPAQIGPYLRQARTAAGLTLQEAADAVGLTATTWGNVERGTRTVRPETLHRMLASLGLASSGPWYEVWRPIDAQPKKNSGKK